MVETMVNGPSSGPAPGPPVPATPGSPGSWRTWPHRKLRETAPHHAGWRQPSRRWQHVGVVDAVSSGQSRSHQRQPCRQDGLGPARRPGRMPGCGRPRCKASVAGRIRPALLTRRWSSKAIWMRSGWSSASIFWVLRRRSCFKSHYPRCTGALSYPFSTPRHSSFRWIGA